MCVSQSANQPNSKKQKKLVSTFIISEQFLLGVPLQSSSVRSGLGLGFGVWGLGFGVRSSGFGVRGLVWGLGLPLGVRGG